MLLSPKSTSLLIITCPSNVDVPETPIVVELISPVTLPVIVPVAVRF